MSFFTCVDDRCDGLYYNIYIVFHKENFISCNCLFMSVATADLKSMLIHLLMRSEQFRHRVNPCVLLIGKIGLMNINQPIKDGNLSNGKGFRESTPNYVSSKHSLLWNLGIIPTAKGVKGSTLEEWWGQFTVIDVITFAIFILWLETVLKMTHHVTLLNIFIVAFTIQLTAILLTFMVCSLCMSEVLCKLI